MWPAHSFDTDEGDADPVICARIRSAPRNRCAEARGPRKSRVGRQRACPPRSVGFAL